MKRLIALLGFLLLVGVIAIPVLAHGPGWGRGGSMMGGREDRPGYRSMHGGTYGRMTEEKRNQLDKLHRKFHDETTDLRTEIRTKSGALNTLLSSSNPDAGEAKAMQKEISDLSAELSQARIQFALDERKINPDLRMGMGYGYPMGHHDRKMSHDRYMEHHGPQMGYDRHMGRHGPQMGHDSHMGGYSPGSCRN